MTSVLDASAVLAVLRGEQGRERVVEVLGNAVASTVNYAEVIANLVMRGLPPAIARVQFEALRIATIPFDDEQAVETGNLRRYTHQYGLSLADRACLALARLRQLQVLTADRTWAELKIGIDVRVIR